MDITGAILAYGVAFICLAAFALLIVAVLYGIYHILDYTGLWKVILGIILFIPAVIYLIYRVASGKGLNDDTDTEVN